MTSPMLDTLSTRASTTGALSRWARRASFMSRVRLAITPVATMDFMINLSELLRAQKQSGVASMSRVKAATATLTPSAVKKIAS